MLVGRIIYVKIGNLNLNNVISVHNVNLMEYLIDYANEIGIIDIETK